MVQAPKHLTMMFFSFTVLKSPFHCEGVFFALGDLSGRRRETHSSSAGGGAAETIEQQA